MSALSMDILTEMWVANTNVTATYTGWQDISTKILVRDDVGELRIARGSTSETSNRISPSSLVGQINNRNGIFSDQNPVGIYYGLIGRNTKIRTSRRYARDAFGRTSSNGWGSADSGQAWSTNGGSAANYSVGSGTGTISNASVNVIRETFFDPISGSGLLDATICVTMKPGVVATGSSIQMAVELRRADASNYLFAVIDFGTSGLATPIIVARVAGVNTVLSSADKELVYDSTTQMRVEFTVTGGQYIVRMWDLADPNTQSWTYADDSTTAGAAITAAGSVGCRSLLATGNTNGVISTKFDDLVVQDVRFSGELPGLPQQWDTTGTDIWVPFVARGRLDRLTQGSRRLQSVMTRATSAADALLDFWPCEDASGSTQVANAVEGGQPMVVGGTTPTFGTSMAPGTASGLTLASATDSGLHGPVRSSSSTAFSVQFLANVASAPAAGNRLFAVTMVGGTYPLWVLAFVPGGGVDTWGLEIYTDGGGLAVSNHFAFSIGGVDEPYGRDLYFILDMRQNGGNVEYEVRVFDYTTGANASTTGSYAGTLGQPNLIIVPSASGEVGIGAGTKYAQIGVLETSSNFAAWAPADSYDATAFVNGVAGEDPVDRLVRLCAENSIDLVVQGTSSGRGVTMGPQAIDTLYNLIYECVDVDQGVLFETRTQLGFTYRAASSLYNQTAVALDYAQNHLSGPLQAKPDELYIRNSVTVARKNGSSITVQDMTSRLSVSEPPSGVGLYDRGTTTVNCRYDNDVVQLAYWLLALGTIDEPRYPGITVELHRAELLASTSLSQQVVGIDSGDYFTIANPPAWLPQFNIECLTLGYTETLSKFRWAMTFATRPGAPWRVIVLDSSTGNEARLDFYQQTLNGAHNSSTTSLSVATASPWPLITTASGDRPFDIDVQGERMTVTNVTGAASPQTLTVTRSVNGVVKSHLSGETVQLWRPNTLAY